MPSEFVYGWPYYARPTDDVAPDATWSVVSGAANAEYPVEYIANRNPAKPFKATGASVTPRATFDSEVVLVAVSIQNHNLAGAGSVAITSGSGLNEPIPIPANGGDLICRNPWLYFGAELLAQRTSTTFDIPITGGVLGPIAIGEVLLLVALRDVNSNTPWGMRITPVRHQIRHTTFGRSSLRYDKRIRTDRMNITLENREDEDDIRQLEDEAIGGYHPFLFIPDRNVNDAWYALWVPNTFSYTQVKGGKSTMPIELEMISAGPPLYA